MQQNYQLPNPELLQTAGMEMLGMPFHFAKHPNHQDESDTSSSSSMVLPADVPYSAHFYEPVSQDVDLPPASRGVVVMDDDYSSSTASASSLRWQTQGLSLSLCNNNSNPNNFDQQQQLGFMVQDGGYLLPQQQQPLPLLRSSKYLAPGQELLNELCNLKHHTPQRRTNQMEGGGGPSSSYYSSDQSLQSMDILDLQRRKARLLSMLEEVYRRYRKYREQMRAVVASFEAVAGEGAATVYSTLALKAMSRHFRCLRDGIMGQIKATRKAMGEKGSVVPGTTKGQTPRLVMDSSSNHPWRPQRGLPERSVSILRAWLFEHFLHPYPSDVDKHTLARHTGLSRSQVSNWFINARVRLWKPMVEDMYMEETKDQQENTTTNPNPNPNNTTPPQTLAGLENQNHSSIINRTQDFVDSGSPNHHHEGFGVMDTIDFSTYSGTGTGGVSLTLGLQQQHDGDRGVSLAYAPPQNSTMFFARGETMENPVVQFSILDGDGQNLPYRDLMGAHHQLLHDLAG